MPDHPSQKSELRNAALGRRRALDADFRASAALAISLRPLLFDIPPGAVVAGYSPIRSEIDPHPLMRELAARGAQLSLPTIAADGQSLIFRMWREGDPLTRGAFGIAEPSPEAVVVSPDIMLVPLAAFDRRGHRIGYGAGYYDRALADLRCVKPVVAIGMAFATQEILLVPNEAHDVPLDFVLTESETIIIRSS
jgi:5-formyltetrahydrofolate cyclo-ligase